MGPRGDSYTDGRSAVEGRGPREFEEVFRNEYARVFRLAFVILGDEGDAADVTQEAFVRLLRRWERVRTYGQIGAWVRRVAIREAVRVARKRRQPKMWSEIEDRDVAQRLDVHAAVLRLAPMQRACIALYYLQDRPTDEIASLMGTSPATVRVHLHRGRERLAQLLGEEMNDVTR
jgi:RNA polymerase sigma factor (sigma-70 family)